MGACTSSAKIWGWAVTRRRCLNSSTIPAQGPTLDVKLDAMGPNWLASSVRLCFVKASLTVEKALSCYREDRIVSSLLSFCSVKSSLAVRKFCAAGEERCKRGHRQVCANLWAWCHGVQSTSEQPQLCELSGPTFGFTMQGFNMVGGYTEDLKKPQNCQNWGMGASAGGPEKWVWALARNNTVQDVL